ncbi:hypothetical protein SAMN00790413_05162 [Deinococcus hopiensis KR-140]|uniref:Uncharacterized protein n=1 Tax=Deinococcus hopiensis KR-140 TaxID=695939 RepID=A0A1W1UTP4_9DEIO|nr:hypothetical protein SAMN00790413_05162 [Deinococcus hopiensis KR-140]
MRLEQDGQLQGEEETYSTPLARFHGSVRPVTVPQYPFCGLMRLGPNNGGDPAAQPSNCHTQAGADAREGFAN